MPRVNNFRSLEVNITENMSWSSHISTLTKKKAQKQLYFLRKCKKVKFPSQVFVNFYRVINFPDWKYYKLTWFIHGSGQEGSVACD